MKSDMLLSVSSEDGATLSDGATATQTEIRHISNSEVGTWLMCRNSYRYQFDMSLQPIRHSDPLSRGILGHDAIAAFYTVIGQTGDIVLAQAASDEVLQRALTDTVTYAMEIVMDVRKILNVYYVMVQGDIPNWDIIEVETKHDLPLNPNYDMPMRLDALVRDKRTGKIILVDHKFTYDFWTEDDLALHPQFPKYIGALRNKGYSVDHCILNQLRTRKLKNPGTDDLLRRTEQRPSLAKIRRFLQEHIVSAEEIVHYRSQPPEVRARLATRVANKMICRSCSVKNLCIAELDGSTIEYLVQTDYKKRTYGYNDDAVVDVKELM